MGDRTSKEMKNAVCSKGDVIIRVPVKYLDQQTAINSVFRQVPREMVAMDALIEANRFGVNWYVQGLNDELLQISIPTELISWED